MSIQGPRSFHDDKMLQDQASGEQSQDQWSSGFSMFRHVTIMFVKRLVYLYISPLLMIDRVTDAVCKVSLKSDQRLWRRFLKGFYHIWAWRPSWSCDLDYLCTRWFPLPIDASNQRTNGPVNAHLRSAAYTNKHV